MAESEGKGPLLAWLCGCVSVTPLRRGEAGPTGREKDKALCLGLLLMAVGVGAFGLTVGRSSLIGGGVNAHPAVGRPIGQMGPLDQGVQSSRAAPPGPRGVTSVGGNFHSEVG